MKNELESTMFGAKDELENEYIVQVSSGEQREEVSKLCNEIEEWIYEGSSEKHEYEKRLNDLKSLLGPLEERAYELEARSEVPGILEEALATLKETSAFVAKNMTWVNASKIDKAKEKLQEFEEWWDAR